jgi:glycosyltransferase involved in cell wall biosynthesis
MAQLSIIIPTLNAVPVLGPTLAALAQIEGAGLVKELIVADGGSVDETRQAATESGAVLIETEAGRGVQLQAGAAAARGDWFLFLHADTVLAEGWSDAVRAFIDAAGTVPYAGWRNRLLALPYGDQGLLIARAHFEEIGGYRNYPLMEDVDIVRRVGRRRLCPINATATTSAAKYRADGYWSRPARNLLCLAFYYLGLPKPLIRKVYG